MKRLWSAAERDDASPPVDFEVHQKTVRRK